MESPLRWLSAASEESIFLGEGLRELAGLLRPPEGTYESPLFDHEIRHLMTNPTDDCPAVVQDKLRQLCDAQENVSSLLAGYKLQALLGLWSARAQLAAAIHVRVAKEEQTDTSASAAVADMDQHAKLSLLLLVPLLESQARRDDGLKKTTLKLLANYLTELPPMSLRDDECLDALEDLLADWHRQENVKSASTVSCLVALAVARRSVFGVLKVMDLLPRLKDGGCILDPSVGKVLVKLKMLEGGKRDPVFIQSANHLSCFHFDDVPEGDYGSADLTGKFSVTCSGGFLYLTDENGVGISKVGTGFADTVRGAIYHRDSSFESGYVACADGVLLHRPKSFDRQDDGLLLARLVDPDTLQASDVLKQGHELDTAAAAGRTETINFLSDGSQFFWLRNLVVEERLRNRTRTSNIVFVDIFRVKDEVIFLGRRLLERREPDEVSKVGLFRELLDSGPTADAIADEEDPKPLSDSNSSSTGIAYKQLQVSPIWTCGHYLSIVLPESQGRRFVGAQQHGNGGDSIRKVLAIQVSFDLTSGQCVGKVELSDPNCNSSLSRGGKVTGMGVVYENLGNRIYTVSNGLIDCYGNSGAPSLSRVRSSLLIKESKKGELGGNDALCAFTEHLGVYSQYCLRDKYLRMERQSGESVNLAMDVLHRFIEAEDVSSTLCLISFLHATAGEAGRNDTKVWTKLRETLWPLLDMPVFMPGLEVITDALMDLLPVDDRHRKAAVVRAMRCSHFQLVDKLFEKEIEHLHLLSRTDDILGQVDDKAFADGVMDYLLDSGVETIQSLRTLQGQQLQARASNSPSPSSPVKYVTAVLGKLMNEAVNKRMAQQQQEVEATLRYYLRSIVQISHGLFKAYNQTLKTLMSMENSVLEAVDKVAEDTVLGSTLAIVVTCLNHDIFSNLEFVQTEVQELVQLLVECRKSLFCKKSSEFSVLLPWEAPRMVESPHPLRDGCKLRETVTVPGAKTLYLTFDPRCASQYDYDRLSVHAGKTTGCKKVAEYGGSTYKSVLGAGWPKSPVEVAGDSVTLAFDVRSGRETNTPDRAVWGFRVLISKVSPSNKKKVDHFEDMSLVLSAGVTRHLSILFEGNALCEAEKECDVLLRSKLLQQCIWKPKARLLSNELSTEDEEMETDLARIKLSVDKVTELQVLAAESSMPPLRTSVKSILQPEIMEEGVISAVIKHLALSDAVDNLTALQAKQSPDLLYLVDLLTESFHKLHALVRRLQVLAELENQWENEVDDVRRGLIDIDDVFFADYQHHESKAKELALLCFLKSLNVAEDTLQQATNKLKTLLEKEVRQQQQKETTEPLAITKKIVQGILERIELLLQVSISTGLGGGGKLMMSSRSLQCWPVDRKKLTRRQSVELEKSLDDSILQIPKLHKVEARKSRSAKTIIENLSMQSNNSSKVPLSPESSVLSQLFEFIGSHPERAVPASSFLLAAAARRQRSRSRIQSLALMKGLLIMCETYGNCPILVQAIANVLRRGSKTEELTCGSLVSRVRESFSETLTALVRMISLNPQASRVSICQLCIIPYAREEETFLVKCGLVQLLDRLCGLFDEVCEEEEELEEQPEHHKLSKMAWVAFKVLANRCVEWEENKAISYDQGSSLAMQVSVLLLNHLMQASKESGMNRATLQEVLLLLTTLSESTLTTCGSI